MSPADVLAFWFVAEHERLWFRSTPEFDQLIRQRFETCWQNAAAGLMDRWADHADGALALVIVLDQFPLNMFRNRPESFATEAKAIAVSRDAIGRGFDEAMPDPRKAFLYMPLMHSESLEDQEHSVALFEAAGLDDNLRFARHHRDLIARFGRFPHRNDILGRTSSDKEIAYLASKEAFTG